MFTIVRDVPVNAGPNAGRVPLSRGDLWRALVLKGYDGALFVPDMASCDLIEREDYSIVREIDLRGERVRERVTMAPERLIRTYRLTGRIRGVLENELLESDGELVLRFAYALEAEDLTPGSDEEAHLAAELESRDMPAVQGTLDVTRRLVADGELDALVDAAVHGRTRVERDVRNMFGALDEGRTGDFVSFMAEDARWTFANADPVEGRSAIKSATERFLTQITSLRHEVTGWWQRDDIAVAEFDVTYVRKDNKVVTIPAANIFRMRDNLVEDFRIHMDVSPVFA